MTPCEKNIFQQFSKPFKIFVNKMKIYIPAAAAGLLRDAEKYKTKLKVEHKESPGCLGERAGVAHY